MFGDYGNKLNGCITNYKGWSFYDKNKDKRADNS